MKKSIGSSTFFANLQYFIAKKVLDAILANTFLSYTGNISTRRKRSLSILSGVIKLKSVFTAESYCRYFILDLCQLFTVSVFTHALRPGLRNSSGYNVINSYIIFRIHTIKIFIITTTIYSTKIYLQLLICSRLNK